LLLSKGASLVQGGAGMVSKGAQGAMDASAAKKRIERMRKK